MLVTLTDWLVLRNKLNYTHTKIGPKDQPHQPSVLIVDSTQMLKLGFSCLWEQQGEHQLTAYVGYFDDQVLAKRRLLLNTA